MLFINFLCLLYLMVLSNSHTISKSIDIDDGTDEVSETITNLDNTRYHRLRRQNHRIDRIHQKYRLREIPSRLPDVTEASIVSTKTTSTETAYTDTIAVNNASTANPTYRSHKRKIGGFWRKFRAKAKTTTNNVNVQKRQVAKRNTRGRFKHGGVKKFIYSNPRNRKKKFYSFIFQQPKTVSEDEDLEVTVDVPLKKKDNNVKFLYTPYVMYASKLTPTMIALMNKAVNNKTTENMNSAIASMNTHLSELKKMYGARKEILPTVSTTTSSYPGTAEIEELLTGIKMKAIQTVVENAPSMVDLISNTVTEAIYRSMHSGYMSTPFSRYLVSTLNIDNILSRPGIEFNEHHNLVTRSITKDPLTLSNIEEILQKELKNIYHKMKCKMTKDSTKYKPNFTSNGTTIPMQPMPVTTTPNKTATTTTNNNNNATTNATTTSIMSTTTKSKSKAPKPLPQPIKSSVKPPASQELSGKNQSVSIFRLERENTLTGVSSRPVMEANVDDYNMLMLYEKMLRKVQEDNAMKLMATANLPLQIQKNERCRLSKRNPETLTNIKLKETVETLYNDGVIMPDYDYLKLMSTQPSNTVDDKGYEPSPSTSYDELSKKIAYDDFVNGYKHYLKFQQEKAKEDNFSAMVKYQAHKHHRVDDIGKYILDKIPQLPPESTVSGIKRLKRFFEDMDMEDQEVSTKTDDSWFRKHFYIFLDYGPPKKFHTSQIVSLKPPMADVSLDSTKTLSTHSTSVTSMLWEIKLGDKLSMKSSKTTQPINLDELTKSLDIMKNIPKNLFYEDNTKPSNETESSTQYVIGWTLPMKMSDKRMNNEDEPKTTNQDIESVTKLISATDTYLTDRHKRANESIADDFGIKEQDEKSSTPIKEMQSDVMLQNKSKNKFGYVDVNLVPTNSITLRVNKTKSIRKNKFRDFLKKLHFKSPKSKKKEKRACTDKRVPRFNPFKRIKNMFKPTAKTTTNVYMEENKTSIINRIVTKLNPLNSPLVEKAVGKHKTTKYNKYAMDMGDLQIPTLNDSSSKFSMSETLKKYPPISFPPSQPTPKIIPMIPVIPSKLSTFLMMMDDGRKSVLYVQPENVHKSTRKIKPPKTKSTTVRTLSTKMTSETSTDVSEVLSVSVKTLRPLSSVVMKALTSTCNETLPDLNLEIAKMQYGLGKTVPPPKIDSRPSTSYLKSISRVPLVKPRIEGLTYNNQLTRFAKLSLNPTKYLKTRQNMKISDELKPFDYHVYDDNNQEIVEKDQFERRSTRPGSEKNFKNVDYFNDLLMWNNDILNIDKVPQPEWRDLVKSVEKDFGAEEYTTPNKYTLMHELKELDMTMGKPRYISKISKAIKNFGDVNTEARNINEGMVRHVALNDKAVVKSKDFIIKGEQKYFQYNKPNVMSDLEHFYTTTMQFPMWNSDKNDNFNGSTGSSMWSNGNITIKSPFKWINDKGKHEDPNKVIHNKPIIWLPERHIIFSPNRTHTKNNGNLHFSLPNPITWGSYDKAKQSEDCLTKMARKFYIGGKPKQPKIKSVDRILRVTSPADSTVSENKPKATKVKISEKSTNIDVCANTNKLKDYRNDFTGSTKDTPALMVDTTLLSYDDEVETVTNGIDINKMSRNSQKMSKSKNAKSKSKKPKVTVNVVAKTSKKPQMYYSTPLPMKPSDFNKFLKEQGMDVESVISPLHGQTALFKSWTTGSKRIPPKFKSTQTRSSTSPSSAMTHLSHFFSKYSTRTNNLRKKPKAPDKTVTNKYNATAEKSNITMKKKFSIDVNSFFTTKRFKREIEPVIDHVLERPYRSQNSHKRVKKLKLFRQKCYEFENSSKPKTKPGTEETFSPALQAKLNQLQDTKRISAPKTHPKSMPRVDSKFIPIFEPQFVPTFEPKTTKKSNTKVASSKKKTKTSTTERTTLFSTLEPAPDDSVSDTPLDVTGSLIFTSEDPRNKEVDITIINFDDVTKKHNTNISPQTVNVLQDESLDIAEKPKQRRPNCQKTTKLIVKVDEPEDLSFESIRSNEKFETPNSSCSSTTEDKPEFNIWPYPSFNADTTRSPQTTKSDSTMFLHDPLFIDRDKEHNPLTLLEKIHKHHGLSNPERVQISSHHYNYDIFYKNANNPRQKVFMKKPHQNMTVYSVKSSTYRTRTSNVKYNDNKAITVREEYTRKKSKQGDKYWNRKWVTIGSKFRNGRNVGTDYSYQNEQDEMRKYNKKGKLVSRNLEKRFFRLYPKLNFIQNKLTLKRMTMTPKATIVTTAATIKASKDTKATTKLYTTRQSETTTDLTPSLDDLIKATKENGTDILNDNRIEDTFQDLRIQFANKKVLNAVDKIKAMTTDEPIDGNSYDITHDLSARLGLVHKNNSKLDDEEFKVLHFPTSDSDVEDDTESVSFKIGTDTLPPHVKPTPQYQDYEDIIRDPEKAAKTASEKDASYKFEQNIFDKSMYGKKSFDGSVFEKAMFGLGTPGTIKGKTYSSILTDIMSYDVTPDYEKDKEKEKEDYYEASTLPDTVKFDSNVISDASPASGKVTKKKGYSIFDSASIIYNKSYLSHFGLPNSKLLVLDPQKKTEKSTEKPWFPLSGNTLSVLFKNPLEGHLGFGVKPIIQVNQPKSGQGITLQVTPVPTPMEIVQAALSQKQMNPGWSQMPIFQNYNNWPQIQATSLGYNPIQTGVRYNTSEMYGIYMEPGILNYDYNPPIAPVGGDNFFVNLSTSLNAEKNSNHYESRRFSAQTKSTPKIAVMKSSSATSTYAHNTRKSISKPDPFPIKAYSYNKKTKSMSKNSNSYKDDTATVQILPDVAQRNIKREIPNPDTYTAKDVAALEVIVDLMKNTLGYEEKDLGNLFTTANIIYPMKSIHQSHDTTNAIQVHIAIPCDGQNTKKRSPLDPVRVRKVFSAKMSTPVDLEYQVHSFESGTLDPPTTVAFDDYGLSPGMYLLIDKPKSGYALKPVKTNIDLSQIKSRQAVNMSAMDLKGETTLRHGNIKNLAKVTLSKNFISAVNKQLVELYENLTKANDSRKRKRRNTTPTATKVITPDLATNTIGDITSSYRMRRVIDWEAVKKYFGFDKVCDCKCKANKPMCRACAASDAVIDELTFEFDNLGKYMKDHCTEIQTYFWVNPSGGLKLRDAVDRIDESLRNYYKRVKGKCHGRTCEALGNHIDRKRFAKSAIVVKQSSIENLVDDIISVTDDLNKILAIQTCYNDKLRVKGEEMIKNMNSCISYKPFGKRSDPETTKKKFVKNVYSLDNINVNIICNPEASTAESFENSNLHSMVTMANQKIQDQSHVPDNFLEFEVDNVKSHNKRKGFKGLFLNRNKKNKKLFTYFTVQETKTSKVPFKREANNKLEVPLVGDSGGTFWLEYLRAGTTIEPQIIKQAMFQKEPKLDVSIVQTSDLFLKDKDHSNNVDNSISSTTAENVLENFNEILNVFEKILDNKRNDHNDIFSRKLDSKVTIKIKSVKPTTSTESIMLLSNETNKTINSTEIQSDQKLKSDKSKTTMANISEKVNEPSSTTASTEFNNKNSDITSKDKLPTDVVQQADLPSNDLPSTNNSSATLPQTYASTETNPILEETIPSESLVSEEISTETSGSAADLTITESKYANSSENLLFENISSDVTSGETNSNTELDALKTDMSTEPNINQKSTTTSEETTTKITTAAASVTTEKPTQKKTSVSSKIGFLERMTAATNLLGLTNNFYLLKKTSPVLGHSNNNSTASEKDLNHVSRKPPENHPKIVIINEYDQLVDNALNENDKNSDKYKNLLLNIIQYEANRLNDEWYKIAYASDKYDGNKRSATITGGTTWQSTSRTNLLEDSVTGTMEGTKKRGLLNKLVSKIGMKVVSSKKKVAHCSSSNYSTTNAITDKIRPRHTDKASAEFTTQGDETARIKTKGTVKSQTKLQKTIKPPEASHVYPSSHTVCDIQETFNHVTQRRQELPEKTFEAYVKDIPCFKYRRLQRSFFITHKSRRPKWDWIRNKRSVSDFDGNKNIGDNVGYCDKFEMFVKDDDGIYRIMDRKKRDATRRSLNYQLRHLPLLKPGKNELYVMVGDTVTLDCPLRIQRSTYSQFNWGTNPRDLLNCDNVRSDGSALVLRKVGPRNAGRYTCSVDGVVRSSTRVTVVTLPAVDVVFLPTYRTQRECNYDDLKAIQQLGREMSSAARCGNICSIRIDEPICQRDRATNRSLLRSTGVLTMSPRRVQCSVQCRRDLFSSLLRLVVANLPPVMNTRVVLHKDGFNETLKPLKYVGRPMNTHTLRKKDSSGHCEYHKFSSVAKPGQMKIVNLCNPGFYLLKELNVCAPCPANMSSSRGANTCSPCATGTAAAPGAAECHSVAHRLRRYDWWWYPPCGYVLAFGGVVCACGVCMVLGLLVHLGSRGVDPTGPCDRISSVCLDGPVPTKPHLMSGYVHSRTRPLSPSRVILARFFKPSLPSSRGTVFDSQETRFELWKEKNIPPSLPDIDFDIDTS